MHNDVVTYISAMCEMVLPKNDGASLSTLSSGFKTIFGVSQSRCQIVS